jgi:hypothetical protein
MMFDMDPYDRLVLIEQKLSQLQNIQDQLIQNAEITAQHLRTVSTAISALQNNYLELYVMQTLRDPGDNNDKTTTNS